MKDRPEESNRWNRNETGRLLRLVGPLLQIPALWALTQRPQWASSHMTWVYAGFFAGMVLVIAGLVMNIAGFRR